MPAKLYTFVFCFRCIWEIKVNRERDLWLHFDRIKFASKSCDDGIVDIYIKSRLNPYLSICGENVSLAKELPILSAAELSPDGGEPAVTLQFIGRSSPTRAVFKIAWTELFHLPRNQDGSLMTSKLTEGGNNVEETVEGCDFLCPGENGLCIPARLVCNGVVNCPNLTTTLQGTFFFILGNTTALFFILLLFVAAPSVSDESEELCAKEPTPTVNWFYIGAGAVVTIVLLCCVCVCLCRRLCRCCCDDD